MNVLEELIYYCKESQPAGALMLTGEWGCGKTYLVENELKNCLKDSHVLIRISLFGLESISDVKTEVKKCWFNEFVNQTSPIKLEKKKTENISKGIKNAINGVSDLLPESFKKIITGALTINILDFVEVKPKIDNKMVVLIFDDLERSNISTSDLLGCINHYCENLHISTIIVANEDKISNGHNDKIKYDEIKEKIVQRTINYAPDYSSIISNVIDDFLNDSAQLKEYNDFLKSNKKMLVQLFSSEEIDEVKMEIIENRYHDMSNEQISTNNKNNILSIIKNKPHNIRSFKCALQDFKRIYLLLKEKEIGNFEKYLFSYVCYVLSFKTRIFYDLTDNKRINFEEIISVLYPTFFNINYISEGITNWVETGKWSEETIKCELDYHYKRDKAFTPEEKVRFFRLTDLEEKDVEEGFPKLMEKAYNGELDLNDYALFIANCALIRELNLNHPNIDWKKVYDGILLKINSMIALNEKTGLFTCIIDDNDKETFTPEEWKAYKLLDHFVYDHVLEFNSSKKFYLDELLISPKETLLTIKDMRFNTFDVEMAKSTVKVFEILKNADKYYFVVYFADSWNSILSRDEFIIKDEDNGFLMLVNLLTELSNKYERELLPICKKHTDDFIVVVNHLIEKQQKTNH